MHVILSYRYFAQRKGSRKRFFYPPFFLQSTKLTSYNGRLIGCRISCQGTVGIISSDIVTSFILFMCNVPVYNNMGLLISTMHSWV